MKRLILISVLLVVLMISITVSASAERVDVQSIDWSEYTLDELLEMQEGISSEISELQRQWAIEHGDRKITFDREKVSVYAGKTATLAPTVEKVIETAPDTTKLLWSSSDPAIATVNANGTVTGVSKGVAVITCSAEDNDAIFAEKEIEVILPVKSVQMQEANATLLIYENGEENGLQLYATVLPEDAYCQELLWTSSNEEIAVVDEKGYVSALKPGSVYITATSADAYSAGAVKGVCKITVSQAASSIELSDTEIVMKLGSYQNLSAKVLPENTSNKNVIWESEAPEIVTATYGQLRAVSCGEAIVKVIAADGSGVEAECRVTVIQMVTGIKVEEIANPVVLNKDEEKALTVTVLPENATNPEVVWTSSDDSVVSVNEKGVIVGNKGGSATITCSAADGSNVSLSINIFVPTIAVEETKIEISSKSGMDIPVHFYGEEGNFEASASNSQNYFTIIETGLIEEGTTVIHVDPVRYGKGTISLIDRGDSRNNITLEISIAHEAVYDTVSYPTASYSEIMREPDKYDGENLSIYGRVLQKQEGTSGYGPGSYAVLRVATKGWDDVFYVTCPNYVAEGIIVDDYITVYGECGGTTTYKTIMGTSVTVPALTAEKIILGRA